MGGRYETLQHRRTPCTLAEMIDCDVHHARGTDEELITYLSKGWREYVADRGPAGFVPLTVQDGLAESARLHASRHLPREWRPARFGLRD